MIRVWSDNLGAGLLDRHGTRGAAFAYDLSAHQGRAVSLTMPVRLASWNQEWGIHPIFEMNLPEGFLREKLAWASPRPPVPSTTSICWQWSDDRRSAACATPRPTPTWTRRCQSSRWTRSCGTGATVTFSAT